MLSGLGVVPAKARRRNVISKGDESIGSVQNTMSNFSIEVYALPVQRHKRQGAPRGGPVKHAKNRSKLRYTVKLTRVERQEELIAGLAGEGQGQKTSLTTDRKTGRGV